MFVEKLDLFGFKSFASRTEVSLSRGITAIVGPNGCGKSNISDAFRWVLGEQNARTLRGEKIQDVIFKGSGTAKPLGMAEVCLTVVNDDGRLPLEYTHVAVSRRLFRSGDSEFSINKIPCRLKDIRDLFSGTGLGSHGYAVIERDMIDQVLSDRDDARRFLFEEAAGIIRYKQRRKESERRLEGVEQDLTRIEDMIREIERGVRSLARQAGKVRRWRRFKEELDRHEVRLAWERWKDLRAQSASSEDIHRRREEERADLSSRLAVIEAQRESRRLRLLECSDRLEAAQRALEEAGRTAAAAAEEIRVLGARREAWAGEEEDLHLRIGRHRERLAQLAVERAPVAPRIEELRTSFGAAEEGAREAARLRLEAEKALREVRARVQEAQQIHLDLSSHRSGTRQDLESKRERREASVGRLDGLRQHLEVFTGREEQVERELASAETRLGGLEGERTGIEAEQSERRQERESLRRHRAENARSAADLARSLSSVRSRLEVLEEQHHRHAGFDAAVRRLLEERAGLAGLLGVVGEEVRLRPGQEALGRSVLGERVQWVLVRDEPAAVELMGSLRERGLGGVTFFPLREAGRNEPLPAGFEALFEPSEAARPFLAYLAAATRLVSSLGEAQEVSRQSGARAVTPEGDAVDPAGLLFLAGGESEEAEILRRESEIPQLRAQAETSESSLRELEAVGERLRGEEAAAEEALAALAARMDACEAQRAQAGEARTALRTELAMLREERSRLGAEREALENEGARLEEEVARLCEAVGRTEQDSVDAQRSFESLRVQAEEQERIKDERVREAAEREMEALRLRNECSSEEARLAALEREGEELTRSIAEAEKRREERTLDSERAGARIEELSSGQAGLEAARAAREEELRQAREEHTGAQDGLFQLDSELKAQREKLDSVVQTLHEEDVERLQTRAQADQVRERVREEFGIDLETWSPPAEEPVARPRRRARRAAAEVPAEADSGDGGTPLSGESRQPEDLEEDEELEGEELSEDEALSEAAGPGAPDSAVEAAESAAGEQPSGEAPAPFTPETRRARMAELRRILDSLGNLNFLAEEEYRANKERLEFHQKQAADLKQAREDLLEAIRRINETAGQMFEETFRTVQDNFRTTYQELFPGGEATLTLQGGDPLEGDIEISARPRGKKLESIRLLSSGERALTALGLLFAIYLAKPSPVCLLDEVDAPLDDANLDRFLSMVRHFSERTQFVVITHNKKTMETADRLFGVTMEEPGVSKIVSVHLDGGIPENLAGPAGTTRGLEEGEPAGTA